MPPAPENPDLLSEVRSLKEKLGEQSELLVKSAEKLSQLEAENLVLRDENQALNTTSNKQRRFRTQVWPMQPLETPTTESNDIRKPPPLNGDGTAKKTQACAVEESVSVIDAEEETLEGETTTRSAVTTNLDGVFSKRFDAIQSMVERLPGVGPPIWRNDPNSYTDTPFTDEIALVEMPRNFSFPNLRMYDESDDLYEILQHRAEPLLNYIVRFNHEKVAIPGCNASTAISVFKRWVLPDGDL
ncbi:hypothetical protein F2Q69_00021953 [Brassica cretica]|uniref:Uncharacterized protein n=1 Tax=Brassica cretica TaxID=69181 RepID=A0A8S9Q3C6_BRACR|nr:hypothetical protein F2Q69_00021953 [Brassica cretica]